MNTVIFEVRSLADTLADAARAMPGDVVALLNAGVLGRARYCSLNLSQMCYI